MDDVKYVYLRDTNGQRRGVVAYRYNLMRERLAVGASFLSSDDNFDPDVGRELALLRLTETPAVRDIPSYAAGNRTLLKAALTVATRTGHTDPVWTGSSETARKLARRMLRKR